MTSPILRLFAEALRFIGVGSVGVALYYAVLWFLTELVGLWYFASAVFASLASFSTLFVLQKYWTFRERDTSRIHQQFRAYALWSTTSMVLNLVFLYSLVEYLGLWYLAAQVVSTIALTLASYVVSRRIFRS